MISLQTDPETQVVEPEKPCVNVCDQYFIIFTYIAVRRTIPPPGRMHELRFLETNLRR